MNIGIFVNTPAQAHFFKNIVKILEKKGHIVNFLVRDYGETVDIMRAFGFNFFLYSRPPIRKTGKIISLPMDLLTANKFLQRNKPEIVLGFGGHEAYTGFLLQRPSIVFQDSEPHINLAYLLQYKMFMPFVNSIVTTLTFTDNLGKKQIKVDSFKEISYLHPRYFTPDKTIFDSLNINKNEEFVIIRFNAFDAVHDTGIGSFSLEQKRCLIEKLEKHTRIFISAEKEIPNDFKKYLLNIPKQKIHDCLYFAKLLITDTQTMTTEAGILGTPVVRCNSFVGKNDMGNFIELEHKYNLIFSFRNPNHAIEKALAILEDHTIKQQWKEKKQRLLNDKIDITAFMVWYIENYPMSFKEMKVNPDIQKKFQ